MTKSPKSRPATSSWGHHRAVFADKMDRHRRSGRHQQGDRGKAFKVNDPRKLIAASAGARKLIRERPDERPFGA
jgi:hypothetical protein